MLSLFKNLYTQILNSIILDKSNILAVLSDEKNPDGGFVFPDNVFPDEVQIKRVRFDENILNTLAMLEYSKLTGLLIIPPMNDLRGFSQEFRKKFSGYKNVAEIVLDYIGKQLTSDSILVVLVPEIYLVLQSLGNFRKKIFDLITPEVIISHDFPWREYGTSTLYPMIMSTIVLRKTENSRIPLYFFKLENPKNETESDTIYSDFKNLIKREGGQTRYGYVIRDRNQIEGNWTYEYNHPGIEKKKNDLKVFGATKNLSDIFDIYLGKISLSRESNQLSTENSKGVPVLEGRDLLQDGNLSFETRFKMIDPPQKALLKQGDILIRAMFVNTPKSKLAVIDVENPQTLAAVSNSIIVLRPTLRLNENERLFIFNYLKSDQFLEFLGLDNVTISINIDSIQKIPVPIPDESVSIALQSLEEASIQLKKLVDEVENAKDAIFKTQTGTDARINTLTAGRMARQRLEAAKLAEDYRHRIRTQYPHPLAYLWRVLEAGIPDIEGYRHILDITEVTLSYLACTALAVVRSVTDKEVKYLDSMVSNVCDRGHGTSMGDWISILRELSTSKAFTQIESSIPYYEAFRFLADEKMVEVVDRLKKLRNDFAHGRGPKSTIDIQSFYKSARKDIDALYQAMDFLTEYPIRYIEETRRDSITQKTYYKYREIRGDHPFVPIEHGVYLDKDLEAKSLYLVDREKKLHLLRPFLFRRECPECGSLSTFFLDTYNVKTDTVVIKSMEHGHIIKDSDISESMRYVGLLK